MPLAIELLLDALARSNTKASGKLLIIENASNLPGELTRVAW